MKLKPIIFFRVVWMDAYQGIDDDAYVNQWEEYLQDYEGFDVYNFLPTSTPEVKEPTYYIEFTGLHYEKLKLAKVGVPDEVIRATGQTIALISENPEDEQHYLVGWYKNATIYLKTQVTEDLEGNRIEYQATAPINKSSRLLPMKNRTFRIKHGDGASLWTSATITDRELLDIWNYVNQFPG